MLPGFFIREPFSGGRVALLPQKKHSDKPEAITRITCSLTSQREFCRIINAKYPVLRLFELFCEEMNLFPIS